LDEATPADIEAHAAGFLAAMADDLNTPRAIMELERLANDSDAAARRVARKLGSEILGLSFQATAGR
jgi:cysteinyl-tRNA synthetase